AVVAAETEAIGRQAIKLIEVEYEELPIAVTAEAALKPGAPLIAPPEAADSNLLVGPLRTMTKASGDVEKGFSEADYVFENTYHNRAIPHMPIEPRACLARWDNDKVTIWSTTQKPFPDRVNLAKVLELPETRVRVIAPYLGGGFGGKSGGRLAMLAALLARETGRPVSLRFSREEDMLARTRPETITQIKIGVKKDGSFTAIEGKITAFGGGYNWVLSTTGEEGIFCLFRSPNYRYDVRTVYTNQPPGGQLRGVLNGPALFGLSQLSDRIAEELGYSSPMELAKQTHIRAGDDSGYESLGKKRPVSSCHIDECIEKGARAIGWADQWRGWKTPVKVNGPKRIGLGFAPLVHVAGMLVTATGAVVNVNEDGTASLYTAVTELGQGAITTQAQVLAEASGIPLEDIQVIFADTDVTPVDSSGQVASSTATVRSQATKLAGEDVKAQILERAAAELEVAPADLDIDNGRIYLKAKPEQAVTLKALMAKIISGLVPIIGRGATSYGNWPQVAFNYGAHFALVEVDTETGKVRVLKYVAAHDLGQALNPTIVEGQIYGGAVMGMSIALSEGLIFDDKGKPRNLSPTDYKLFSTDDCPEIIPIMVEASDPMTPYGAKGQGEAALVGTAPCLANAIYNAIGIRFNEIPITPEKVRKAIQAKGK
ncbi:MAG: molybdopterin cofactor-binding domain-containing protein, partial [Dehalococcoidales bacterium]